MSGVRQAPAPGQRGAEEKVWEQWISWGDMLFGGMNAAEFMQHRTIEPALQETVRSTLAAEAKARSQRTMKGELIPISKADADRLDRLFAAQSGLKEVVKDAIENPVAAILAGLNVNDDGQFLGQCVERYKDSLPLSVIRETVKTTCMRLRNNIGGWWTLPFAPLGTDDFKVRWDDDAEPFQILAVTASGPAAFQITQGESDFPPGERTKVYELRVHPSGAFFSRNRRYAFELMGWG